MTDRKTPDTSREFQRRQFLGMGLKGLSLFVAGGLLRHEMALAAGAPQAPFFSLAQIGPLQAPDANGILLPPGFRSRVIARSGLPPTPNSDYLWHGSPDGGACFPMSDGGWVYTSNSELRDGAGGVGALRFDADGNIVDAYSILQNTSVNCAGGPTPWGTWLSCEEFAGGRVWECDPRGERPAVVRPGLGTFRHEAVAVDPVNDCLYLTEDETDGGLYRFRATAGLPDLTAGVLEIASLVPDGDVNRVEWLPVPDPTAQEIPTRQQVAGYAPFRGGEGIYFHAGKIYFSTKHDNRVWSYDVASGHLDVLYDLATSHTPILSGVDNIVITPSGDVLVAEDKGNMQVVVLSPEGLVLPLLQILNHDASEVTGPAFDPSFQHMYFSSQRGSEGQRTTGITFEITRA